MKAEIISIGTELLQGEITDTNASYLASQLPLLGIDLYWVSQVGDDKDRLVEVLKRAWQRSELILTTGGLGPTDDDLTRTTIAELLAEKLEIEPSLESSLRERFARFGLEMPLSNFRQATIIPSAQPLRNTRGTAPGWWVAKDGRILVALPGPPAEMHEMWQHEVQPRLREYATAIILSRTLKTFGLSEAAVGELAFPLFASANPTLGVYAKADGVHLRFIAKAETEEEAARMVAESEVSLKAVLGKYIWGSDNDTPETVVGHLLVKKGLSLAVTEDYSGGWLATSITASPQSLTFFKGGFIASSAEAKAALGVNAEVISQHGAVSPEVAQAMAEAVRILFKADIGVSIVGREETFSAKGIAYISIAAARSSKVSSISGRIWGKQRVATSALFELRKWLFSLD